MTDRLRLAGLLTLEAAVVAGLHALARLDGFGVRWSERDEWLNTAPSEDVLAVATLLVALVIAYWLLISTVGYACAVAGGRPRLTRAARLVTVPAIRRLTGRALAFSIAAASVTGSFSPAVADGTSDPTVVVVEVGPDGRLLPPGTEPREKSPVLPPHLDRAPLGADPRIVEVPSVADQPDGAVAHTVTVRRGDHMWSLAEQHLGRVLGRTDLGDHEVARYWVAVIDANRSTIRSGNPDLIYPGEVLTLPPVA